MPIPVTSWTIVRSTLKCNDSLLKRGFTLVELIMTIVVVSAVAVPLSLLVGQHLESLVQSQDYTAAVNLARLEMEKVNNLSYGNIISASFSPYSGTNYDVTRTVTYAQGGAATPESMKKIVVEVKPAGGTDVLASLVTYLTKNVTYGI